MHGSLEGIHLSCIWHGVALSFSKLVELCSLKNGAKTSILGFLNKILSKLIIKTSTHVSPKQTVYPKLYMVDILSDIICHWLRRVWFCKHQYRLWCYFQQWYECLVKTQIYIIDTLSHQIILCFFLGSFHLLYSKWIVAYISCPIRDTVASLRSYLLF